MFAPNLNISCEIASRAASSSPSRETWRTYLRWQEAQFLFLLKLTLCLSNWTAAPTGKCHTRSVLWFQVGNEINNSRKFNKEGEWQEEATFRLFLPFSSEPTWNLPSWISIGSPDSFRRPMVRMRLPFPPDLSPDKTIKLPYPLALRLETHLLWFLSNLTGWIARFRLYLPFSSDSSMPTWDGGRESALFLPTNSLVQEISAASDPLLSSTQPGPTFCAPIWLEMSIVEGWESRLSAAGNGGIFYLVCSFC